MVISILRKYFLKTLITLTLISLCTITAIGWFLCRPAPYNITTQDIPTNLPAKTVWIATDKQQGIAGWLVLGKPKQGVILLLHGVRSNRLQMRARAQMLYQHGYSVLLIDLPAHGQSSGKHITFGFNEAKGVNHVLTYLRQTMPQEPIGVIGVSLGAASLVLANPNPAPNVVVLESMYPNITKATSNRLQIRLGKLGQVLTPLLMWQLPLQLGISSQELCPLCQIPNLHAPVLIASGAIDKHTTADETLQIFKVANTLQSSPKALWLVNGAAHVDLQTFDSVAYANHILPFLDEYLHAKGKH